ncbi:hypothetical protein ASG81_22940 [Paenibacillus sp. Soil522]|nr:hypothetical protein ASG81_22940 [Paenibacillus sp. Soil522]
MIGNSKDILQAVQVYQSLGEPTRLKIAMMLSEENFKIGRLFMGSLMWGKTIQRTLLNILMVRISMKKISSKR